MRFCPLTAGATAPLSMAIALLGAIVAGALADEVFSAGLAMVKEIASEWGCAAGSFTLLGKCSPKMAFS